MAFPKLLLSTDGGRGGYGKNGSRQTTLTKTLGARLRDWRGGLWTSLWQGAQMVEVTAAPKPHDMAARVERMKQQLKDGAVAGAASTLRQVEG
eukprot:10628290-Prorocentrum_lima.AAC.1